MAYLEKGEIYNPIEERIFRKTVLPLAHLTNGRVYATKRKLENSYGVPKPFQEFIKNLNV